MAGRPKTYDRSEALERAMNLFWRKGLAGAHLAELVSVTGLNRHSLYKEFGGKEGLFREALGRYLTDAAQTYRAVLEAQPLGVGNILRYFRSIRFDADYHGCFMIHTLGQQHVVDDEAFSMTVTTARMATRLFKRNIAAAIDSGDLPQGTDVNGLAETLSVLDHGLATYGIFGSTRSAPRSVVAQVERLLGAGVPPKG